MRNSYEGYLFSYFQRHHCGMLIFNIMFEIIRNNLLSQYHNFLCTYRCHKSNTIHEIAHTSFKSSSKHFRINGDKTLSQVSTFVRRPPFSHVRTITRTCNGKQNAETMMRTGKTLLTNKKQELYYF